MRVSLTFVTRNGIATGSERLIFPLNVRFLEVLNENDESGYPYVTMKMKVIESRPTEQLGRDVSCSLLTLVERSFDSEDEGDAEESQ